jgi:hypothetical protein
VESVDAWKENHRGSKGGTATTISGSALPSTAHKIVYHIYQHSGRCSCCFSFNATHRTIAEIIYNKSSGSRCDILNAEPIFGPNIDALRGETVRQSPLPVNVHLNDLPRELIDGYRDVTLCGVSK